MWALEAQPSFLRLEPAGEQKSNISIRNTSRRRRRHRLESKINKLGRLTRSVDVDQFRRFNWRHVGHDECKQTGVKADDFRVSGHVVDDVDCSA